MYYITAVLLQFGHYIDPLVCIMKKKNKKKKLELIYFALSSQNARHI